MIDIKDNKITKIFFKNISLFLIFGILIASLTTYINYEYKYNEVVKVINKSATENYTKIVSKTKSLISNGEYALSSIQTNDIFIDYLQNQGDKKNAISLFLNSINNNKNFFQLRYIDKDGQEVIRVNRDTKQDIVFVTDEKDLQNKADRYYFKETIVNSNKLFWYSKFDLNMENDIIEKPYKPTFRVSKNIYYKGEFYGILIVNTDMSKLNKFIKSFANFEISIIDKDGNYLLSSDSKKEWSRYLDKPYNFKLDHPNIMKNHTKHYFHVHSMASIFQNIDEISIILNVNKQFVEQLSNENTTYLYSIAFIIFIASILIGLIISIPTSKLYMDYNKVYQKNLRYMDTIDKYVLTMDVNTDKKIVHISKALCEVSGYTKEELIGKSPSIFKSGEISDPIYKEIWNKITNGLIWDGDFYNITKNKEYFWIHSTILPNYDETNNITSYTAISEDITDKKTIEKLSRTDTLTQICNRMVIDEVLEREFNRFLRSKIIFSVILIDIDKFKLVNDNYGHLIGDQVLIHFSNILKENSRKTDIVGRWGGEEFMMICLDTEINGAFQVSENIRKITENHTFDVIGKCTISLGVSQIKDNDNINSLLKRVDENLYKAKNTGRNKSMAD